MNRVRREATLRALLVTCLLALPVVARAESHDAAAAEALFDDARKSMKEGRYAEACSKFEASQRLDPGVGTLLNLGDCLEHVGRTASAWARFREAASLAVAASQTEREQAARERAQALEPRLVRLAVRPQSADANDAGLHIARDGVELGRELWGTAVPVDPGAHVVIAEAPGKTTWTTTVQVDDAAGKTQVVDIPVLAREERAMSSSGNTLRVVGLVAGGIGLVALGFGTGFALDAKSSYADARDRCTDAGCNDASREQARSAGNTADIATAFFIGGGVALTAGVVLWLTAPRHASAAAVGARGLTLQF